MALNFLNDGYFAGKVGIGVESPTNTLHVSGPSTLATQGTVLKIENTADQGSAQDIHIYNQYDRDIGIKFETLGGTNYIWQDSNSDDALILSSGGSNRTNDATLIINQNHSVIMPNGSVGIGLTNPSYKLSVNGTIQSDLIRGYTYPDHSFLDFDYDQTAVTNSTALTSIGRVSYISDSNGNDPATSIGHSFMTGTTDIDTATPLLTILNNGNVGIGTDSPDTIMEILGANPILTIRDSDTSSSTATSTIRFAESNANDTLGNYWDVGYSPVNLLNFDFNGSTKMTINSSGNVGIGTTSPDEKLKVIGSVLVSNNEFYKVENTTGTNYKIAGLTNGNVIQIGAIDYTSAGTIFAGGDNVSITTGGASGSTRIKIASSGNVGIGTTSPSYKLDVESSTTPLHLNRTGGATALIGLDINGTTRGLLGATTTAAFVSYSTAAAPLVTVANTGGVQFNTYGAGTLVTDASGNITVSSGGGAGGPYLPLAGNTTATAMTGDIYFANQQQARFLTSSNAVGLRMQSSGTSSFIDNEVGDMYIRQEANGNDMIFQADNGSGGNAVYFKLDGSEQRIKFAEETSFQANTRHNDNVIAQFGNGDDLQIYHDGSNSYIEDAGTGSLIVKTNSFQMLNAAGTEYIMTAVQDGGISLRFNNSEKLATTTTGVTVTGQLTVTNGIEMTAGNFNAGDGERIRLGNSADFQIYHDGSNSYIDNNTGNLTIDSGVHLLARTATGENLANFYANGANELFYDNSKKLSTEAVGVGTATTAGGTLIDGWKTTTQANAINDTTIATTAYVNNKIALIPAGLQFEGTWDASTGNPPSASPENGQFWIVSVAGSTSLSGITDWKVGDWAIYVVAGSGTDGWQKVDNSSVLDGFGTGGSVAGWAGSGTSNTLTNAPITFSGNNITFAGRVDAPTMSIADTGTLDSSVKLRVAGNLQLGSDNSGGAITKIYESSGLNLDSGNASRNIYFRINGTEKLKIDTSGNAIFAGDVILGDALLSNQVNTDVDTGTETVANVAIATYTAAFFDFVVKKSTNVRSGTVYACHDGTNVEFTETSTQDLGDTSDVTLSVDISGGNMRLRATTTSDDWSVKSLIRAI